eukprot:482625-Rhodomonas_salina.2
MTSERGTPATPPGSTPPPPPRLRPRRPSSPSPAPPAARHRRNRVRAQSVLPWEMRGEGARRGAA